MPDPDDVRHLIRNEIKLGRCPSEVFRNVAIQLFDYTSVSFKTAQRYFDALRLGDENLQKQFGLSLELEQLLVQINKECEQATEGMERQKCPAQKCKIRMLSERYAVDVKVDGFSFGGLVLFDLFHGQQRTLQTNLNLSPELMSYHYDLAAIDAAHFLFIDKSQQSVDQTYTIHLLQLDHKKLKAKLLDSKTLSGHYFWCFVDLAVPHRFLVLSVPDRVGNLYCLELVDSKMKLGIEDRFGADYNDMNVKFKDNHLYTLILDGHGDFSHFNIAQTAINASVRPVLCELKHQEGINLRDLFYCHYAWSDQVGYALRSFGEPNTCIYKIDLNEQKISIALILNMDPNVGISLNEDEILSVLTLNKYTNQHVCRRIALRRPDKLLKLSLFAVHQRSMFLNKHEQERLVEKLPPGLRPFECYV